jgi:hypothetical protein
VDAKYGSAEAILALPADRAQAILEDPEASVYARAKACMRLAVVGGSSAVPALARLLDHPQLGHYARIALEPMPGDAASEALRAAAERLSGKGLVGVIHSIAARRDTLAIPLLAQLRNSPDAEVAQAAELALARVRPRP